MPNNLETLNKAIQLYDLKGVHPAANVIPMMDEEQYQALVEDIKANGFIDAIVITDNNELIDGRNRICASIDIELDAPIERHTPSDPISYVVGKNLKRRHLTVGQRAMIGVEIEKYYAEDAKERKIEAGKKYGENHPKEEVLPNLGQPLTKRDKTEKSAVKAAKDVNIGHGSIHKAKKLKEEAPELAEEVSIGSKSLNGAYTEFVDREKTRPITPDPKPKPTKEYLTLKDHKGNDVKYPKPKGKSTFNRTNDAVQWAWWTWNPVTGCLHGCRYCYAREMATSPTFQHTYPVGFTPLLRHDRLSAPKNTTFPKDQDKPESTRVFVCSMSDLFGEWVPAEWIEKVIESIRIAPAWDYLFLTKNPGRYKEFEHKMPTTSWLGATIDSQERADEVLPIMREIKGVGVKWVSLEPLLEPIAADFKGLDWVVIGAQSETKQPGGTKIPGFSPKFEWVSGVVGQAKRDGVSVYMKANLLGQVSGQWPGMELIQEMPISRSKIDELPF